MKKILLVVCLALLGIAFAHSRPVKIVPANGSSVKSVKTVEITFDEAVEAAFSTFKVYAYTGELSNGAMRAFAKSKITLKNDAAARADLSATKTGTTKNIQITLKPNLKSGTYLIIWRILGSDTHGVDGYSFFKIKP
jgi:copper resistance protein C